VSVSLPPFLLSFFISCSSSFGFFSPKMNLFYKKKPNYTKEKSRNIWIE